MIDVFSHFNYCSTRLIKAENVRVAGGYVRCFAVLVDIKHVYRSVPAIVSDLLDSPLAGHPFDTLIFGGSHAHNRLPQKARICWPLANMSVNFQLLEDLYSYTGTLGARRMALRRRIAYRSVSLAQTMNQTRQARKLCLSITARVLFEFYQGPSFTCKRHSNSA